MRDKIYEIAFNSKALELSKEQSNITEYSRGF